MSNFEELVARVVVEPSNFKHANAIVQALRSMHGEELAVALATVNRLLGDADVAVVRAMLGVVVQLGSSFHAPLAPLEPANHQGGQGQGD